MTKTTFRKLTSLVLCVMMILTMNAQALFFAVPVRAAEHCGLSVDNVTPALGETFTVTVSFPAMQEKFDASDLRVNFDKTLVEATVVTASNITGAGKQSSTADEANGKGYFSASYIATECDPIDFPGVTLTATFKFKDGVAVGTEATFEADRNDFYISRYDPAVFDDVEVMPADAVRSVKVTATCPHASLTEHPSEPSTCQTEGHGAYYTCSICGKMFTDAAGENETAAIPTLPLADHEYGELIPEVAAVTHETDGTAAHYECSVCHKLFDANYNEVTADDLVIPAGSHDYVISYDANGHWGECECGASYPWEEHDFIWVTDQPATEEETGLKHEECTFCGQIRNEGTVIPRLYPSHSGDATVVYVKDGGTGDGSQASPFGSLEDAYAAAAALTDDVVIHLDGVTTVETGHFTAPAHTNAITLTGTLKDAHTADWFFISGGPLTLKNLTIEAGTRSVFFLAGVNPFTVDEGVVTTLAKASVYGVGSASAGITAGDVNITVKSGAFNDVAIFRQGAPNNIDGNGRITVSGTAEINNLVVARNSWKTITNAEIILEGGKVNRYAGNCDRTASTMLGENKTGVSGKFTLTVKSGFDFANSFNETNTGIFFGISGSTVATSGKDAVGVAEYVLMLDEAIYDTVKNNADKCQADSFDTIKKLGSGIPKSANAVFVANSGDDAAAGTKDAPVKTLAKAIEKLPNGGVVVLIGAVTIETPADQSHNIMPAHSGTITLTSYYDGVDYRNTKYGSETLVPCLDLRNGIYSLDFHGDIVMDYLRINVGVSDSTNKPIANALITMDYHNLTVTANVETTYLYANGNPVDPTKFDQTYYTTDKSGNSARNYPPIILMGQNANNTATADDADPNAPKGGETITRDFTLNVAGGVWQSLRIGDRYLKTANTLDMHATMNISGGTFTVWTTAFQGSNMNVMGVAQAGTTANYVCDINITGGTFYGEIAGFGMPGAVVQPERVQKGTVNINVLGGNFIREYNGSTTAFIFAASSSKAGLQSFDGAKVNIVIDPDKLTLKNDLSVSTLEGVTATLTQTKEFDKVGFFGLDSYTAESYKAIPATINPNAGNKRDDITASGSCGQSVTWEYYGDTKTLKILGSGEMANYSGSFSAPWERYRTEIRYVEIEDGVTSVGDYAFSGSIALESVSIPESVTRVGYAAFSYCSALPEIHLPSGLSEIGAYAFRGCTSLGEITVPGGVTTIPMNTFYSCTALETAVLCEGVQTIGASAFDGCTGLREISLPDSLLSLGENSFRDCTVLTRLYLPKNLGRLPYSSGAGQQFGFAFAGCKGIETITVAADVASIPAVADWSITNSYFARCGLSGLKEIKILEGSTKIHSNAFSGLSSLEKVSLPNSIREVEPNAFANCDALIYNEYDTGAYLGNTENPYLVLMKPKYSNIAAIQSLQIHPDTKVIAGSALSGCSSLTGIAIPDGVVGIGASAFYNCSSLRTVTIPNSVTRINASAFSGCAFLSTVYFQGTQEDWYNMTVGTDNEPLYNARIVFVCDHDYGELIPEVPAVTHETDGIAAHYVCSHCGKLFDANYNEVTAAELLIPAGEHRFVWVVDRAATEAEDGVKHEECTCGARRSEGTVIPKTGSGEEIGDGDPCIRVLSVTARAGEEAQVVLEVKNNPGVAFLALSLQYDTEVLALVSATNGTLFSAFTSGSNFLWDSEGDTTEDGVLLTLTFRIADGAEAGEYPVRIVVRECYNEGEEDVAIAVTAGKITVIDYLYGDANGDGEINGKDITRLRKYLANYDYDTGTSTVEIGLGADANGDGAVNGKDITRLRKYLANYDYDTGTSTVSLGPQ